MCPIRGAAVKEQRISVFQIVENEKLLLKSLSSFGKSEKLKFSTNWSISLHSSRRKIGTSQFFHKYQKD